MKNRYVAVVASVMLSLFSASGVYAADFSVSEITPKQNVGLFQVSENAEFDLTFDGIGGDGYLKVVDINGKEIRKKHFTTESAENQEGKTENKTTVNLGKFTPGWYRLYVTDTEGNSVYKSFASFCSVHNLSDRTETDTPFAADQAGQEVLTDTEKDNYARALKLMGIGLVRERGYWSQNYYDYDVIEKQVESLVKNDVDILEVWGKPNEKAWSDSLTDVYDMQKNYATEFKGKVSAWEVQNEPDIVKGLTPDLYAAYMKSAALGAYDADETIVKTFGGLCNPTPYFREMIFRNDLMSYIDAYNVHTHATGNEVYTSFGSGLLKDGRALSAIYGGGKPLWVTESGARFSIDSNQNLLEKNFKAQAKYVITSFAESFEQAGTDKHFWFLSRHYIENGREYGIFSDNNAPYPSVSALSTLTYHLGKAEYKGTLKILPKNCKGYVFDTGNGDAVVMWSTDGKENCVQLRTTQNADIVNMLGTVTSRRCWAKHGMINVPITDEPIIVKLGTSADERDYYKKSFPKYNKNTAGEGMARVVLQPTYGNMEISSNEYIIDPGAEYTATVNVYNFSTNGAKRGKITATPDEGITIIGDRSKNFSVSKHESTTVTFTFRIDENIKKGERLYIKYEGNTADVSTSVSGFKVRSNFTSDEIKNKTSFDGYYLASNWTNNTSGTGFTKNTIGQSLEMKMKFNGGVRYHYPQYAVSEGMLGGTSGIYININNKSAETGKWGVFAWTVTGSSFHVYLDDMKQGEQFLAINWDNIEYYSGPDTILKPGDITHISFGFNPDTDNQYDYVINDFGYFITEESEIEENNEFLIKGLEDQKVYAEGAEIKARVQIPAALEDFTVYLNYEPYTDFEISENEAVINLTGLGEGAYNIIVSGRDTFNYRPRKQINFYIGDIFVDDGVFY